MLDFMYSDKLLVDGIEEESVRELYDEYLDKYGKDIPKDYLEQMRNDVLSGFYSLYSSCYIMQFYDEYGLMKEKYNLYKLFVDYIKHSHPDLSNSTILDVGGGIVPALGRRLAKEAKHVIVVDKDITSTDNPTNLEVIKKEITKASELPKADIVIGFLPCETTRFIMEHAAKTNADFFIELCGCIHDIELAVQLRMGFDFDYLAYKQHEMYYQYAKQMIKEYKLGEFQPEEDFGIMPYPIIGNKRI